MAFIAVGFAVVVALFAYVLIRWPDNFFADDSYFYFQVAWNVARGFGSTFNNVMTTNGYHPLWMLVCVAVFKVLPAKAAAVHGIGAMISLFDAGALLLLCAILRRTAPGFWWVALCTYTPFCFLTQLGTEGALSGFFLAAMVLAAYKLYSAPDKAAGFLFTLCGALAVLSRLDNIFVVSAIFVSCFLASPAPVRRRIQSILLLCLPVYCIFWGAYIFSNLHWFGTIEPISGLLKSHPHGEVRRLTVPPHIAMLGMAIILPCIAILAKFRRDTFFRVVELPFAIGVLFHATYILFIMSSETRWTWYYTSWLLLSAILLSRVFALVLDPLRGTIRWVLPALSLAGLFFIWTLGYKRFGHYIYIPIADTMQAVSNQNHLHTVVVFDRPGYMAYYSNIPIVSLDGLMGNLAFQHELANKGIAAFDAENHVDAFIGPPEPFGATAKNLFCDHVYLSSVQFHCVPASPGLWNVDSVEVFARLTGTSAGSLPLAPQNQLINAPVTVWRLPVAASSSVVSAP